MTRDQKLAWLSVGTIVLGLWAVFFAFILAFAIHNLFFSMGYKGDSTGYTITFGMFLIFCALPGYLAWRCFKASRRLSRERAMQFNSKQAFE
jgi:uncharacterized membrane protein